MAKPGNPRVLRHLILLSLLVVISLTAGAIDQSDDVTLMRPQQLEKALRLATDTNLEAATGARQGDISALYRIARELQEKKHLEEALWIFHHLADERGHIASQLSLGFVYYQEFSDPNKALHYFISAGEKGPNQAALYNAARIFTEHHNFVPAVAYLQVAARMATTHPEMSTTKLTMTCSDAFQVVSEAIVNRGGLSVAAARDIFGYARLDLGRPVQSIAPDTWKSAMNILNKVEEKYAQTGQRDTDSLQGAIALLRGIWEKESTRLSPLQTYLLLRHMNDALAAISAVDDAYVPAAAGYAEALARSTLCHGKPDDENESSDRDLSKTQESLVCFQVAVSSAMSYYRRAGDKEGAERVFELATRHFSGTTAWKSQDQTPHQFNPAITDRRPIWRTVPLSRVLRALYGKHKDIFVREVAATQWDRQKKADIGADGSVVTGAAPEATVLVPLGWVQSRDAKAWSEYGPLYDGQGWNSDLCRYVYSLCKELKPFESLLCRVEENNDGTVKSNQCGVHDVIRLARIQHSTTVLPHCGNNNWHLSIFWCLSGCDGLSLTVADEDVDRLPTGSAVVVDTSFQYSLTNAGDSEAILVVFQLPHPNMPEDA